MGLLSTIGAASGRAFGLTRVGAAIRDAYFNLTTLLLPGNGTNGAQNNTFLDSSTNNFTITRNGNTTQGTFSPFSQTGWSNYFDGTGDTLSLPNNAAFAMSNGAFTIEFWFYTSSISQTGYILQTDTNSTALYLSFSSSTLRLTDASTVYVSTPTLVANQWYHIAVVRSGTGTNQTVIYTNGVAGTAGTCAQTFTQSGPAIGGNGYLGYISNFRMVKGTAVYTAAFTPPTAPLTNITNTSVLTCQSNRFVDNGTANSGSGFAITVNGDTSVQAFSPFAPTAAYSAATVGGSGYFDGSGDFLTSSHPDMNATWTIETWIYRSSGGVNQCIAMMNNGGFSGVFIFINTSNYIEVNNGVNSTGAFNNVAVPVNAWTHIAVVRSGGTTTGYINGAVAGSNTFTPSTVSAARIGQYHGGDTMFFTGYISNFRVVNGTAVYTSAFTPPTAPLTAITNTSLLANFTNAGITDATAKNDLETVGNAQISTTQSKFGGSSMYFDGTGDYLISSESNICNFALGDFTIEFWLYLNTTSGTQNIIDPRPASTSGAYTTLYTSGGTIRFFTQTTDRITSSSVNTNEWFHVAVCRSGTSTKMFFNGTQTGSTYTDTNSYVSSRLVIGAGFANTSSITNAMNGYIDDLRISRYARYTANFTAPTAAFPLQ